MLGVIITGPPGAGKSSAATEFHDGLGDEGIANALVEIDELERSYPPVGRERALNNLARLCASHRELEPEILTVTATVEDDDYMHALFAALGTDDRFVVRLEAGTGTLEQRIRQREPEGWSGLEELVESSSELAKTMTDLTEVDLVLNTEDLPVEEVVARIRSELP